jgi:3-oxoacyl-[acyl-carrier-protein] synthase II
MTPIVVTGMGAVTPLGAGVQSTWDALLQGQSGISALPSDLYDERFPSRIAGQFKENHKLDALFSPKEQRRMGRFIMLGMLAAEEALRDADWFPQSQALKERTGVLVGSGIGGLPEIEQWALALAEGGPKAVSPFFVPSALINLFAGQLSIQYGFMGPNIGTVTACASGAHAIGEAAQMIIRGQADVVIAGGAEAALCPLGISGFSALKALSSKRNATPTEASRPFDRGRDGFVIAEGAGIVVLESLDHARQRGAKIYGQLVGYGASGDANHITAPKEDGAGARACIQAALDQAGISSNHVGYINAHGTSTPAGDLVELRALEQIFPAGTRVSSTKSAIGHSLGAAGAIEAIFTLQALASGSVPPTLNLEDPEETTLDLIPKVAQHGLDLRYGLSNSFGFGGTNAALLFSRVD